MEDRGGNGLQEWKATAAAASNRGDTTSDLTKSEHMKGMRKKIMAGFLVLITLLLFAGMVSLLELQRLSKHTKAIIATGPHNSYTLTAQVEDLESSAYRLLMPSITTLVVAIVIILAFMFLLELYYTRPIVRLERSLDNYIKHNIPFTKKIEGRDEVAGLRKNIETLIAETKNQRSK